MRLIRLLFRNIYPKFKNIIFYLPNILRGNKISFFSIISKGVLLNYCQIGKYTYIGPYSLLNSVMIGKYSSIGPHVVIGGAEHSYWWYSTSHFISTQNIGGRLTEIGNDVWIGAHAVIRQGVKIGDGAVIGAGAMVLNNVEPYSIVVGVPAKKIKSRFDKKIIDDLLRLNYWSLSPKNAKNIINKYLD